MYYTSPVVLTKPIGNNALSYTQRKVLGSSCELYIPALHKGTRDDLQISKHIGFEEVDHKGNLQQCFGLAQLIEISSGNISTYIIDNHNHALYIRYREHLATRLGAGATLIHIDQHADMGMPEMGIDTTKCKNLDYITTYTNEVCNVGNFIQPAVDSGLIGEIMQVRSVSKLLEVYNTGEITPGYILDIDIDFWSDHLPSKEEIKVIQTLYKQASICTIALSPYFIDIKKAIAITKILFSA